MERVERFLRITAYIAIICACAFLGFRAWSEVSLAPPVKGKNIVGARIVLPKVEGVSPLPTVVLALSTNCKYCKENAPFIRELARAFDNSTSKAKLLVVMPQTEIEASQYLRDELSLTLPFVSSFSLEASGIRGTPTVITLSSSGIVTGEWLGLIASGNIQKTVDDIFRMANQ